MSVSPVRMINSGKVHQHAAVVPAATSMTHLGSGM